MPEKNRAREEKFQNKIVPERKASMTKPKPHKPTKASEFYLPSEDRVHSE
jgi:hypothetical protein